MLETDDDRLAIVTGLGERILIDDKEVWGIFENAFIELDIDVDSSTPLVQVRDIDIPKVDRGSIVDRSGLRYSVVQVQPDGEGMSVLRLSE